MGHWPRLLHSLSAVRANMICTGDNNTVKCDSELRICKRHNWHVHPSPDCNDETTDLIHKSQNALVPYPTMIHSEQKCALFCSDWSIVGYGTGAFWDLWNWSIQNHLHTYIRQATGLDAWASRVKCPARFVSHLHEIWAPGSNPAFSRGTQLVSFRFEYRLPVPEHRN